MNGRARHRLARWAAGETRAVAAGAPGPRQAVGRRLAGLLALLALLLPACARKTTAAAEQDTLRRLPPDALVYAELNVRGVFSAVPTQRALLQALVPNACLALVDTTWTASLAWWDGPAGELAIGLTGPTLDTVRECLERGLELSPQAPPPEAAALGAVALYGRARPPARVTSVFPDEPSPEELEALVTGVAPPTVADPAEERDEEPAGVVLLVLGPRTQLLVSPSLAPRMTALRAGGPTLAETPLLASFGRLPEGQFVAAANLPPGLRGRVGTLLREAGLERAVPEPTAAGLSVTLQRARLELRARLETADGEQARRLVEALEALRRSTRALVDGLASQPTAPAGLAAATRLLDGLRLGLDGNAVTVATGVEDAVASLAMLGVVGGQTYLTYLDQARDVQDEVALRQAEQAAAADERLRDSGARDEAYRALEQLRALQLDQEAETFRRRRLQGQLRQLAERLREAGGDVAAVDTLRLELLLLTDALTSPPEDPAPPPSDSPLDF